MAIRKRNLKKPAARKSTPVESSKKTLYKNSKQNQLVTRKRILIVLLIVLAVTLIYYFRGLFVVALVNGQPILRLSVIQELEKRGGNQTLTSLITQVLIQQEAEKRGVVVTDSELDGEVKKIEDNLKKQGQKLDEALLFQGLTREDFKEQIRFQKLVEKLLAKDIKVTDEEIKKFIDQNKDNLPKDLKPEEVTASARQQLEQQKLGTKAQEWIADLQEKANIKYFVSY